MPDLERLLADLSPAEQDLLRRRLQRRREERPAIPRQTGERGPFPLSSSQERFWLMEQLQPGSAAYHVPLALRLRGRLAPAHLWASLQRVVERHAGLRTTFSLDGGRPVQRIASRLAVPLPVVDLDGLGRRSAGTEAARLARRFNRSPFDLATGPLLRAVLLVLAREDHLLLVNQHHVITDARSTEILLADLAAGYRSRLTGDPAPEAPPPLRYADYACWQRRRLSEGALAPDVAYWRDALAGLPVLELPTDRPRPPVPTFRGSREALRVDRSLVRELAALGRGRGATLFMTLLAAFQALLSRYSGQDDLAVGSPIAQRKPRELEGLIGPFVNTLVLRGDLSGDPRFEELVDRARAVALEAYAHQDLPFEVVVDAVAPARELSHAPVFQVMLVLQEAEERPIELPGLSARRVDLEPDKAALDLILTLQETPDGLAGLLEYRTDLFTAVTARRLLGHFRNLLREVVADPGRRLSRLGVLGPAERQQVLREWNDTGRTDPQEAPAHRAFSRRAAAAPDAAAVAMGEELWTYGALAERVGRLVRALRGLGAGPETVVAVYLDRSPDLVAALLAVLEAGSAFMPLDPGYPRERLAYMLADAGAALLLTRESMRAGAPAGAGAVCTLEELSARPAPEDGPAPPVAHHPEHLAYLIYTSGSTGRPKGVEVCHRGLSNLQRMQREAFALGPGDCVLHFASPSFDAAVWELLLPLSAGGCLVLATPDERLPGPLLVRLLARRRIALATLPPSVLEALPDASLPDLADLIVAGETCPAGVVDRWAPGRRFFNAYGPTEGTVDTTVGRCRAGAGPPTVGRPIRNVEALVLDRRSLLQPVGVPGELCIAGALLARGYRGRPALTAERFVPHPTAERPGLRLYRTGDLARHRGDGELELLGRLDGQVKIRGHRIEPGEVAAALREHPGVREAAVVARPGPAGRPLLAAYVVPRGEAPPSGVLRSHLEERLPRFMVPAAFVVLAELPRSPNGKLDARALPAPETAADGGATAFAPPQSRAEQALAAIWRQELNLSRVGIDENFFDLGGDSLLAVKILERIHRELDESLGVVSFFERPTVRGLAELVTGRADPTVRAEGGSERGARRRLAQMRRNRAARANTIDRRPL